MPHTHFGRAKVMAVSTRQRVAPKRQPMHQFAHHCGDEPLPRNLARNSIGRSFNKVRKRCNSNDLNSMFETVAGELRAKLGAVSALMDARAGHEAQGVKAGPGRASRRRATHQQPGATGVEGAGGICRGAGGRRRGLAGLRDDPPHISNPAPLVWRAPEGPEGTGGLRGAAPNEVRP